jgi:hypothetical protein
MKAYCDNVIVSGIDTGDLAPDQEMTATRRLQSAAGDGRLELVTSRLSRDEQGRTTRALARFQLEQGWPKWKKVENDTALLGIQTTHHYGMFVSGPILTPIVNETLYAAIRAILPKTKQEGLTTLDVRCPERLRLLRHPRQQGSLGGLLPWSTHCAAD